MLELEFHFKVAEYPLQKVTFRLPKRLIGLVDELVRRGLFDSRSEVVRMALMWEKKEKKS
ncbi:MAG: ribbon-helix-helix domain-containing protein [Candidatus Hodarchaeales archaeon]|jgi:Arc/MetJ-type ribon-helix-helix transcriptional regulator